MSRVIASRRSPHDALAWTLVLSCGHEIEVRTKGRSRGPTRQIQACDTCLASRLARMAK